MADRGQVVSDSLGQVCDEVLSAVRNVCECALDFDKFDNVA